MPTLLNQDGFKFFFYSNEHEPKHVHVINGDEFAKVELSTFSVVDNLMKSKNLKKALAIIECNNEIFERKWDEYFSKR